MTVLHVVPGLTEQWNGIAVAAKLLSKEQGAQCVEIKDVSRREIQNADEVWVHSCWTPCVWRVCSLVIRAHKRLVRMPHGNLDLVRLKYHGWKKRLVGPIERHFLRKASRIVATCEAEKGWIETYLGKHCPPVEVTDIKRFFDFSRAERVDRVDGEGMGSRIERGKRVDGKLHLLYLGRQHPLKGLEYLKEAVKGIEGVELRVVSNAFGEEKDKVWDWCDVLVLPTLSENFGLVIAEALERGKRVITTDGAPAWGDGNDYGGRLIYIRGFRNSSINVRVALLTDHIKRAIHGLR